MHLPRCAATRSRRLGEGIRLVALTLFQLPGLMPLLRGDALPCTHDNLWHGFRIVALREMLRHGWLFSRWLPNLALGYGYPFFNYREPLPYLVGEGLFALGVPLPWVLGLIYVAAMVGGAWGASVLARDIYGERAAWVAGLAYGLGPYVLLDALRRGNMPESVALGLAPWLFVVARRVVVERRRASIVATVLLLTALFLTHNISSLLLAPFLGAYVVLIGLRYRRRGGWPYALGAVAVAVLLTAWFWLPALTEQGWAQLHLSRTTRNNDFHYNFVGWGEMLATVPVPHEPAYLNPPMRVYLGVGQGVLAAIGAWVAMIWPRDREQRWTTGLWLLSACGYLWLASPGSVKLWEGVPLLSFVQFPWRLVGRALLPASLLAGAGIEVLAAAMERRAASRWRVWLGRGLIGVVAVGLTVAAWPDMHPPKGMCPTAERPGLQELYALELDGWLGIDPESSYFPIWVEEHPSDTALAEAFIAGRLPERFDTGSLPEGATVAAASYRPLSADLTLRSPEAFEARWLGLYFPGWEVRIDGEPVALGAEDDTGLMTFAVPGGEHHLTVRLGATPAREAGAALGVAGIAGAVALGWLARRNSDRWSLPEVHGLDAVGPALLVVAVLLVAIRWGPFALWRASREAGSSYREVETYAVHDYDGGLTLLGYTLPDDPIPADGELEVDLLWQARHTPRAAYRTSVLLRGADGQFWSPAGTARPRGYESPPATTSWQPGQYAYDPHAVAPFAGTPPGRYDVVVGVFDAATLAAASRLDPDGQPLGPDLVLGTIEVVAPNQAPELAALGVATEAEPVVCGPLALWDMVVDRSTAVPGDVVAVRWVWEVLRTPEAGSGGAGAVLELVDAAGITAKTWQLAPATPWWPTERWLAGQRWVGRHVVRLPGDLDSGTYRLTVRLAECPGVLASERVAVVAPARTMIVPEGYVPGDVQFGGEVALVGTTVKPTAPARGDAVEVGLAWRAMTTMDSSYRVFLHLVGPDDRIVAQSDGEPADWTRPTTGWAEGEVVSETRIVTLPADAPTGQYELRAGLYTVSGPPLKTSDGAESAVVAVFEIGE